jgi:hypothetical protein
LKFGFASIPKTYRRLMAENIIAARQFSEFKGLIGENPSSLARSEFKV